MFHVVPHPSRIGYFTDVYTAALGAPAASRAIQVIGPMRPRLLAFGAVWVAMIVAAAAGNYPTPLVGFGGSAIVGYLLSIAAALIAVGLGKWLGQFGIFSAHETRVLSAHRMPDDMFEYAEKATSRGLRCIIAGAGGAGDGGGGGLPSNFPR